MDSKFKEPTINMKAVLLDLLDVVRAEDNGKAGQWRAVYKTHHMTLKAMAKQTYGCLIQLEVVYADSPSGIIWRVAITRYGLKVAKQIEKQKPRHNDTAINVDKKKPRALRTINWQVNVNQEAGKQIYEDAKAMKADKKQSFTKTMNNLIAMHKELKMGQVGLLQSLYPEAYATLLLIARNEIEMEGSGELRGLIAEFKRHIQNAPQSANIGLNSSVSVGLRVMSRDDDDGSLIEVKQDTEAGRRASENFLRSLGALQPQQTGNPKQLAVTALPMPIFDED